MTNKSDLRSRYDEEQRRNQEQSQILHLQNQIDDLRRQLKDTNNKYAWAMEQMRKNEALVTQIQALVDKAGQETLQTVEGYRRELTNLRKEIANALLKIEEGLKPIRELQTQVHHLGEQRKRDQAQVPLWLNRIDVLETVVQELDTRIREGDDRVRQLFSQLDRLREADEHASQEVRRLHEEFQIEKQGLRRMATEAQQMVADTQGSIHELAARLLRQDELIDQLDKRLVVLPPQLELISQQLPEIVSDLKRIERVGTDRFLMTQERLEELRGQQDEKVAEVRIQEEEHNHQLLSWLERLDIWTREYESKIVRVQGRIEAVQQAHMERLQDIELRERRMLDTLLNALQQVAAQNQAEQLAAEPQG